LARVRMLEAVKARHAVPELVRVSGSPWPIVPPIVEEASAGRLAIIDGTHRVYDARDRHLGQIKAFVVRGATALPAPPYEGWDKVRVLTVKTAREKRYRGFDPGAFRPIRQALEQWAG
jgi:hypothetical protein